ncbi:MAG: hypothetical protein ACI4SU_07790 [Anaerovoracaceae bacterium]
MTLESAKSVLLTDAAAAGGKMNCETGEKTNCETGETVKKRRQMQAEFCVWKNPGRTFRVRLFAWCGFFA